MELKEYLKIFRKNVKLIISITIVAILGTLAFTLIKPAYYEASISFLVARVGADTASDYKYDDYYAIKANDLVAETVEQWLKNPEAVQSIYNDAKVDGKFSSLKDMARKFKVTKLTSQLVEVRLKAKKSDDAKKVAESTSKILKNKISLINDTEAKNGAFKVVDSAPVILETKPSIVLNIIVAVFSGLILGIFGALGKEYFG